MTGDLFTFLYFHLITSKFIYFQHEARCSEYCDVVGIPFLHIFLSFCFHLWYIYVTARFLQGKCSCFQYPICTGVAGWTVFACKTIVACLIVHASVNSLASFHTVRVTGCLFTELVQLLCHSGCVQTIQPAC